MKRKLYHKIIGLFLSAILTVGIFFPQSVLISIAREPSGAEPVIASGHNHTVALKSDGTVWTWGQNNRGQLGDLSNIDSNTPVPILTLTEVESVAAGYEHSAALKSDGTVWTWGYNYYGQLGIGSSGASADKNAPVQVSGLTGVIAIWAGAYHTLALKDDGTLWAWGHNYYGQLGDQSTSNKTAPVKITGINNLSEIAAGSGYTIALKNDGTVWSWGRNNYGQLGRGTTNTDIFPSQIPGLTNIKSISAGHDHTVALKDDGTLWAWGYNYCGQLGTGTIANSLSPVQLDSLSNVTNASAGFNHTAVLNASGTVLSFGGNIYGQLGDGTIIDNSFPQSADLRGAALLGAGYNHTAAVKGNGTVWSWGRDNHGQLGGNSSETDEYKNVPIQTLKNDNEAFKLFENDEVTVSFDAQGGFPIPEITVALNFPYGELPAPSRNGYRFDGWYTQAAGGEEITSSTIVNEASNHTLYAKWTFILIPLEDISLNKSSVTIEKGKSETLTVIYNPSDTTDSRTASWSSSKASVATVSGGVVIAVSPGTAVITADVGGKTAVCTVTVTSALSSISLNKLSVSIEKGKSEALTIIYNPSDTTDNRTASWSSSKASVATVSGGVVTAVSPGTAVITADVGGKTAVCTVTVTDTPFVPTEITSSVYNVNKQTGYISKILPKTSISAFKFAVGNDNTYIKVYKDNTEIISGYIGTGMTVKLIINGQTYQTLITIVTGDANGEGEVNALDLLVIKRHILGIQSLSGHYKASADVNADVQINALDLLIIKRHILGIEKIK